MINFLTFQNLNVSDKENIFSSLFNIYLTSFIFYRNPSKSINDSSKGAFIYLLIDQSEKLKVKSVVLCE